MVRSATGTMASWNVLVRKKVATPSSKSASFLLTTTGVVTFTVVLEQIVLLIPISLCLTIRVAWKDQRKGH
jgi:hypothetical protein